MGQQPHHGVPHQYYGKIFFCTCTPCHYYEKRDRVVGTREKRTETGGITSMIVM